MVNTTGTNGTDNGTRPPDDVLKASLLEYARLRLSIAARLSNLAAEHHYHIKKSKLKELNREFNIPTVRKPPPMPVITTLVMDEIGDDRTKGKGPEVIKTFLALKGYQIPRSAIREVMEDNDPAGAQTRTPGTKIKIPRKNLTAQGVFQELHCDGHEKLSSAALMMGPVGIAIYGHRDKASGIVVDLRAVPDARHSMVIGHVYFDLLIEYGAMPIQLTFDKGSETGDMYAAHVALRFIYTPDLDPLKFPPVVALKSTNNIPIENLWKWLRQISGRALREWIEDGKTNGLFNSGDIIHIHLFHWVWSQIVQNSLDAFKDYWNYHKSRPNSKKTLPSGVAPLQIFRNPEEYGLERMSVPVEAEVVEGLRDGLACSREEAFRWVPDDFNEAARNVYKTLNSPKLEPSRGWEIFGKMLPALEKMTQMYFT
ncbi:hypothetical protein C8R43DRAFT_880590 [Mycena crocata]|nr:hypothetical protein C8R43DRAFT_880590 [Mycena crocata]